ncbi:MAG: hypothetical protein VKQ33_06650 [Candidatus Sericytochromatia bacterium]|nr:hypothetical protein [Candidatus Sericytochromatia bacterium]
MEPDRDFQALVRRSGILFTTDVGQGPEEWVVAIATPDLVRTQVATQADLVAAGFVRAEGLHRLEAERDRVAALLTAAEERLEAAAAGREAWQAERQALEARARRGELWRQAEHEGVVARNRGEGPEANPYGIEDPGDEIGHQAWRHGWRVRDTLITLNERVHRLLEVRDGERSADADRAAEAEALRARAEAALAAARAELAGLQARLRQLEVDLHHLPALEDALRLAWTEAPHSPECAIWAVASAGGDAVAACNCWRSRFSVQALAPFTAR